MSFLQYIPFVLLFAAATALIYGTLAQSETAAGLIQPALFKGCLQNSESSEKTKTTVTSGIRRSSQRSVRKTAIFQ